MDKRFTIYTADSKVLYVTGEQQPSDGGLVIRKRDGSFFVVPSHNLSYFEAVDTPTAM